MSLRFSGVAIVVGFSLALAACAKSGPASAPVSAQPSPSQRLTCGQDANRPDYLGLRVGSLVRLAAHEEVDGEANWAPDMDYYVGRVTRVQELAGVDFAGCPVVNVEADGEVFHWRVRDIEVVQIEEEGPSRCGQSELFPDYQGVNVATRVEIGRHRAWFGDENWVEDMDAYVGREAVVMGLLGVDEAGCPGVGLDVDGGGYLWRVRDLKVLP